MSLNDVKGFVEAEINVPPSAQHYIIKDQICTETFKKLTDLGITDGDIISLAIQTKSQRTGRGEEGGQQSSAQSQSSRPDSEKLRLQMLVNQNLLREIQENAPELASAVNDPQRFRELFNAHMNQNQAIQREKEEMLAQLNADPLNVEAQKKIEEMIRLEQIQENLQKATEENPEVWGRVNMLYIEALVNNVPIKAFVDSGAQTTIMSPAAAERCGIMRLVDKRYSGTLRGVGTARILGRVWTADLQIGQYSLASSFTVMEGKGVDLLLGLDMLKRHQMCIDLKENCLRVESDKIPFLPESEIPKDFEEELQQEPKIEGPDGTTIGTVTGTVEAGPSSSSQATSSATAPASGTEPSSRITIHPQGSAGNVNTRPSNPTPLSASAPSQTQPSAQITSPSGASRSDYAAPAPISEESIARLTDMGFSREEALTALQHANGNVDLAIGFLL